jgi:hypothetical protein
MPLVGAGRRIEHDDAVVAVTVCDIDLVRRLVDRGLRGHAELGRIAGARPWRDLANLRDELAIKREFQDRAVIVGIAADPDKAPLVNLNAVLAPHPFVALARAAPGSQQVAVDIKLQHRRRRHAAYRARRIERCAFLVVGQRAWTVDHPDIPLPVDGDAADLADDPAVGQRLWPGGIDGESRNFAG